MILHGKWFQKTNYAKKEAEVHVFVLRLISLFLVDVAGNERLRGEHEQRRPESPPHRGPVDTGSFDLRCPFLRDEFNQTNPHCLGSQELFINRKKKKKNIGFHGDLSKV